MAKLLVANWKLHPATEGEAIRLAKAIDARNVVVVPPFPFLSATKKVLKKASLGAQDVFWEEKGPYTGEVSPLMLRSVGVSYVLLGHSERRHWCGESDEMINKKFSAAFYGGLKIILCVGESASVRKRGITAAKKFVEKQIEKDLNGVRSLRGHDARIMIAYEPVWAIGTGVSDTPQETVAIANHITRVLQRKFQLSRVKVLYGGSVNARNASAFLRHKEIAGALVGGASLKAREFRKIIEIASRT